MSTTSHLPLVSRSLRSCSVRTTLQLRRACRGLRPASESRLRRPTQQPQTTAHSWTPHLEPPSLTQIRSRKSQASSVSHLLLFAVFCGGAVVLEYLCSPRSAGARDTWLLQQPTHHLKVQPEDKHNPFGPDMTVPPGHLGNLTPEQDVKLREFWAITLRTFGVRDHDQAVEPEQLQADDAQSATDVETKTKEEKKRSRLSLFKRQDKERPSANGAVTPTKDSGYHDADSDDKYGQVKEFQQILATQSSESLRAAFWSMVKSDHPDALMLRFLRARKWDVDKALVMLISTMRWRSQEQHVDDDVVYKGEGGAVEDSTSPDPVVKREGMDFLTQLRMGKSFLHGTDKQGRPMCFVRVRLHRGGEQTERSLERYTVYVIETARLALRPPVETACIVFDMTGFTMANMDYAPVKFMIKIFEANYPESLGAVLVHKAPWIFQGIWKIIRGWLDPVVAGKVHFTSNVEDLEEFIPKSQIVKELGGDEDWDYRYLEPAPGENDAMKDDASKQQLQQQRDLHVLEYQKQTFNWIAKGKGSEADQIRSERNALAVKLNENYWNLDKYIRARTYYDRTGMISPDGKINFYPPPTGSAAKENVPIPASADDVD